MRCLRVAAAALALGACVLSADDIPPPRIAGVVPPHATTGSIVTIDGDHFCPVPDTGSDEPATCDGAGGIVRFNATSASTTRWTGVAIDAVVPSLAPGTVDVVITIGGRTSNTAQFEITP